MVNELEHEPLFQVAASEQRRWTPDVQCGDMDAHVAAEAWSDFRTDEAAQVVAAHFNLVAAQSGWTVVPVRSSGPIPTGLLACARKDVRGQDWQGYVSDYGDIAGHYAVTVEVDSFEAIC